MKRIIALALILCMLLSACTKGDPTVYKPMLPASSASPSAKSTADETAAPTPATPPSAADPRGLSSEPLTLPEWPSHSEAVDFEAAEGVRVSADAGALYDDTRITVAPVAEGTGRIMEIEEDFRSRGDYLIAAWEVDAGLAPGESLPGEYRVTVDLSTLGIPEAMYPAVRLYRISEDGGCTEYAGELDGSMLTCAASQNSIVGAAIVLVGLITIYGAVRVQEDFYYVYNFHRKHCHEDFDCPDGRYTIHWNMVDVDPEQQTKLDRLGALTEAMEKQAEEAYRQEEANRQDAGFLYRTFNQNKSVAERLADLMAANEEYKQLQASLKIPEMIQRVRGLINTALSYLHEHELVLMPTHRVQFRLITGDGKNFGAAVQSILRDSYINVDITRAWEMLEDTPEAKELWDNLLLTLTHELFHLCQERYHTRWWTDSNRFDEMVALVLESDAKEWYKEQGIITTDPALTENGYWEYFVYSIDEELPTSEAMQFYGYNLSLLVQYLREKTGNDVCVRNLMYARSYRKTPNTSEPLMAAFGLSETQFDQYFRSFCTANRDQFAVGYITYRSTPHYAPRAYEQVPLVKNRGSHVSFRSLGNYTAVIRCFVQDEPEKTVPLLVVLDAGASQDHPEVNMIPRESFSRTKTGVYIPAQKLWTGSWRTYGYRLFLEVYGSSGDHTPGTESGYTVWPLDAPDKPVLALDEKDLLVTLPAATGPADAALTDGILFTVTCSDGKTTEKEVTGEGKAPYGKTVRIPLKELTWEDPGTTEKTLVFQLTIADYLTSSGGERCTSNPSEPVSIVRPGVEPTPEPTPIPTPESTAEPEPESTEEPGLPPESPGGVEFILYKAGIYLENGASEDGLHLASFTPYRKAANMALKDMLDSLLFTSMTMDSGMSFHFSAPARERTVYWTCAGKYYDIEAVENNYEDGESHLTILSGFSLDGHFVSTDYSGLLQPALDAASWSYSRSCFARNYFSNSKVIEEIQFSDAASLLPSDAIPGRLETGSLDFDLAEKLGMDRSDMHYFLTLTISFSGVPEGECRQDYYNDYYTKPDDYTVYTERHYTGHMRDKVEGTITLYFVSVETDWDYRAFEYYGPRP